MVHSWRPRWYLSWFDAQYFLGNGDCDNRRAGVGMGFMANAFWFAFEVFR